MIINGRANGIVIKVKNWAISQNLQTFSLSLNFSYPAINANVVISLLLEVYIKQIYVTPCNTILYIHSFRETAYNFLLYLVIDYIPK